MLQSIRPQRLVYQLSRSPASPSFFQPRCVSTQAKAHRLPRESKLAHAQLTPSSRKRLLHTTLTLHREGALDKSNKPRSGIAQPKPGGNDPKEIFSDFNVLADVPPPASAVDIVLSDGFVLDNGVEVKEGKGVMIVHGEAFTWLARDGGVVKNGMLDLEDDVWGLLEVVQPKPELLILGTGARSLLVSEKSKSKIHQLGIRLDIMDTRNAASYYNMLATERSGDNIAAAMLASEFK